MRRKTAVLYVLLCLVCGPRPCPARPAPNASVSDEQLLAIQRLIQSGSLDNARIETQRLVGIAPADPRLYNFLGAIDAQQGQFEQAEANFKKAIQMDRRFSGAYLNLGHLYQQNAPEGSSAQEKALDVYRLLLTVQPDNVEGNYQMARLLALRANYRLSIQYLSRLPADARQRGPALAVLCADEAGLGHAERVGPLGAKLQNSVDLGEIDVLSIVPVLTQHNQRDLAARLLETLVVRGVASAAALDKLATLYEEKKEFEKARNLLTSQLEAAGPSQASVLNRLAKISYRAGDLEGALGYLAHARDLEPNNAAIHFLFGLICIDLKLPPEAAKSLREAVRLNPKDAYNNYALAAVLLYQHKADESILYFQRFRALRPDDPRGRFALGVAYFEAEQGKAARAELEAAAGRSETRAGALLYLGRLALRDDSLAEATKCLKSAIRAQPSTPQAYIELAQVQLRDKEYDSAEQNLGRALQLAPNDYRANLNLALLYKRTKDPKADEQALRVAKLQKEGEEREQSLLRSLDIRPY